MDLASLLTKHGLPESVKEKIAEQPWQITTVSQLANFFDEAKEIRLQLFEAIESWKQEGAILTGLKAAWKEATAAEIMSLKRSQDGFEDENIDDPLRSEVEASLNERWMKTFSFAILGSLHGVSSLIGRFHRQFK